MHWLWALEALGALVVGTGGTWCIGCGHWRHSVHWLWALEALGALVVGTVGHTFYDKWCIVYADHSRLKSMLNCIRLGSWSHLLDLIPTRQGQSYFRCSSSCSFQVDW